MPPGPIVHRGTSAREERVTDGRSSPHPGRKRQKRPRARPRPFTLFRRDDATPVERRSQRVSRMARETSQGSHLALSLQVGVRFAAPACGDVPHGDAANRQDGALRSASAVPVARSTTGAVASKS